MESKCPVCGKHVEEGVFVEIGGERYLFHEECVEEKGEFISLVLSWAVEEE